ncbi:hypothetical protein [Ichthyenterobacterium magnum]|uniref:Uncharacterized protein n=1 Tax=Ichthyenterobacterium magnum TaxID=1230530 RepID=A0A420DM94_9FLAO|nr:hypothetical protein [Ichthyenterobacterium magnum]RKE95318.1 hypothetical protein BXY80_1505 [Ichthyenterobacterium magnum]
MIKQKQKSTNRESKFLEDVKIEYKNKNIIFGTLIGIVIATTPYLFTFYESVPDEQVWNTFLFTYNSLYYESVYVLAWTLSNKLIPLFLIFIWFFTNRHWWYHTLLVPIAMYIYQIIVILNDDMQFADTNQLFYLLPVMAIVIPSIYLIRAKMFNKLNDADKTMQELEEEFMIKPKGVWGTIKQYF